MNCLARSKPAGKSSFRFSTLSNIDLGRKPFGRRSTGKRNIVSAIKKLIQSYTLKFQIKRDRGVVGYRSLYSGSLKTIKSGDTIKVVSVDDKSMVLASVKIHPATKHDKAYVEILDGDNNVIGHLDGTSWNMSMGAFAGIRKDSRSVSSSWKVSKENSMDVIDDESKRGGEKYGASEKNIVVRDIKTRIIRYALTRAVNGILNVVINWDSVWDMAKAHKMFEPIVMAVTAANIALAPDRKKTVKKEKEEAEKKEKEAEKEAEKAEKEKKKEEAKSGTGAIGAGSH